MNGFQTWMMTAILASGMGSAVIGKAHAMSLDELRTERRALAFHKRGIIGNNDGCDVLYFPKNQTLTPKSFLDQRTTALANTQVGTVAYCTISSGFSFFTHNTKVGTLLDRQSADYGILPTHRNIAADLIAEGKDCLELVIEYTHAHDMETFWSMRMNDTHDVAYRPDKPYLLYPPLKEKHPEWLVGKVAKPTRCGRWSSVNYALPQIRDLAFRYLEEVCRSYDVDGIEMDFFRHLCYFPSVANGGKASPEECALMTTFMHRVRSMTEKEGLRRGRPILVSVRVPDSPGFSRDMGLDVERWLADGLVDILIPTGYFRLNPWSASVQLGHRYGVAVYPCLSDSRVRGATRFSRGSMPCYRARAVNAWQAGADGIHLFNFFNPRMRLWREIGDPRTLVGTDKLYFVTVRDGRPDAWLVGGSAYRTIPMLVPGMPMQLKPGGKAGVDIMIGEDFEAGTRRAGPPAVTAHVRIPGLTDPAALQVTFNKQPLTAPTRKTEWLDYRLDPTWVKRGSNHVAFALAATTMPNKKNPSWGFRYDAGKLPKKPWLMDRPATHTVAEIRDGALLIADRGQSSGDYRYYRIAWGLAEGGKAIIETRMKVVSGISSLIFGNGATGQRLCFYPDRVEFYHNRDRKVALDTGADFHTYRLEIDGPDIALSIDGKPVLDGRSCFAGKRPSYRNTLGFGAANSTELGEALWQYVHATVNSAAVADLCVSVTYPKK